MNCQTCRERMAELADARLDDKTADLVARPHRGLRRVPRGVRRRWPARSAALDTLPVLAALPPAPRRRHGPHRDGEAHAAGPRRLGLVHPRRRQRARGAPAPRWMPAVLQGLGVCALVAPGILRRRAHGDRAPAGRTCAPAWTRWASWSSSPCSRSAPTGDRLETVLTAGHGHEARRAGDRRADQFHGVRPEREREAERPHRALLPCGPGGRARRRPRLPSPGDQPAGPGLDDRLPRRHEGARGRPPSSRSWPPTTRRTPTSASRRAARSTSSEPHHPP